MAQDRYGAMSVNEDGTKPSYFAAVSGLTPVAGATDFISLANPVNSGKLLKVSHFSISGIATAAASFPISLIKRSTLDTGGTPTGLTAVSSDSSDIVAVGLVNTYAANPTLGTVVGTIQNTYISVGALALSGSNEENWMFGTSQAKMPVLRPGETLAMNFLGGTPAGGLVLAIDLAWTEENTQ